MAKIHRSRSCRRSSSENSSATRSCSSPGGTAISSLSDLIQGSGSPKGIITAVVCVLLILGFLFLDWRTLLEKKQVRFNPHIWKRSAAACACRAAAGYGILRPRVFDFPIAAVIFCSFVGLVFLGMWLWYDRRDRRRFELERGRTTFHCIRCDALYTAPAGTTLCKCPKCGHENSRLRF